MRRRGLTRLWFALFTFLLVGAMGVVTWRVLDLERRRHDADVVAKQQERTRLALWRMDSTLAPLLIREASRPYFEYVSFYPAGRAYTRMLRPVDPGEVLVPSPLLTGAPALCRLHFQIEPGGALSSPQAPEGNQRDLAEAQYVESARLIAAADELDGLRRAFGIEKLTKFAQSAWMAGETQSRDMRQDERTRSREENAPADQSGVAGQVDDDVEDAMALKLDAIERENVARDRVIEASRQAQQIADSAYVPGPWSKSKNGPPSEVEIGSMVATWIPRMGADGSDKHPCLILVRPVRFEQGELVQGVWLDWKALETMLLAQVEDLTPQATLTPLVSHANDAPAGEARLAGLPVSFTPGPLEVQQADWLTPTRTTLGVAWLAVLAGIAAIWLVVRALEELGERRGRFVSAVTHELRTPLTAFRLYSQMLADGMVSDADTVHEYHTTLKTESGRLARIVENVLAYARLTDLRSAPRTERLTGRELLDAVVPALTERAREAGASLVVDIDDAGSCALEVDRQTIERVLLNLVDNACKYAVPNTEDKRVHLDAKAHPDRLELVVADHGPGIPRHELATLFRPFRRGRHAGDGLGLGLALARDLLREIHADLRTEQRPGFGASFVVDIPCANAEASAS